MHYEPAYDEQIANLQRRIADMESKVNDGMTYAAVRGMLMMLQEIPWQSSRVASIMKPVQQNLARALIELDK